MSKQEKKELSVNNVDDLVKILNEMEKAMSVDSDRIVLSFTYYDKLRSCLCRTNGHGVIILKCDYDILKAVITPGKCGFLYSENDDGILILSINNFKKLKTTNDFDGFFPYPQFWKAIPEFTYTWGNCPFNVAHNADSIARLNMFKKLFHPKTRVLFNSFAETAIGLSAFINDAGTMLIGLMPLRTTDEKCAEPDENFKRRNKSFMDMLLINAPEQQPKQQPKEKIEPGYVYIDGVRWFIDYKGNKWPSPERKTV